MQFKKLVLIAVAATLLSACGKEPEAPASESTSLFDQVPVTTPYVFGNRQPYPRDAYVRQLELATDMLPVYREMLETQWQQKGELSPAQEEARDQARALLEAIIAEFDGKLTPEGLESLGFRLDMRWVLYGDGLAPIVRYEIGDGAQVLALMRRIEQRAGVAFPWHRHGDTEYLKFGDDNAQVLIGVQPKQLVMTLLPTNDVDRLLPELFDDGPADNPLTVAGLEQRLDGYALPGFGDGYIDHGRFYRLLVDGAADGEVDLTRLGGGPLRLSAGCGGLVEQLIERLPRTVLGTTEVSAERMKVKMVFETTPVIAETLQGLAVSVPGVGRDSDAMYAFGAAMQLSRLRIALKDAIRFLAAASEGCEWADRDTLLAALPQLDAALSPFAAMFKGVYLEAIDMDTDAASGEVTDVKFRGLVQLDDPRGLFAMLGMFVPDLAQLEVPQDGTPIQLPAASLPPGAPELYVAANERILGVASGRDGADLARQLLDESPSPDRPLLSLSYNFKRLSRFMESGVDDLLAQAAPEAGGVDAEQAKAEFERMARIFRNYGTVSFRVIATTQGLTVEEAFNWN